MDRDEELSYLDAAVSEWFWETIKNCKQSRKQFEKFAKNATKEELLQFDREMREVVGFLVEEPFHPPDEILHTENSLEESATWVVSQGYEYFMKVWEEPQMFWSVVEQELEDKREDQSCYGVVVREWLKRFQEHMPL